MELESSHFEDGIGQKVVNVVIIETLSLRGDYLLNESNKGYYMI